MAKEHNALKAGTFIVVSIALAVAIVIGIRGLGFFIDPVEMRAVRFTLQDDLGGLGVGDAVRIGGFKVGDVRKIELVQTEDDQALPATSPAAGASRSHIVVTFAMPKKYHLREGARINIQLSLTGQACLNVDYLGRGVTLPLETPLAGRPDSFRSAMATLSESAPGINGIVSKVNEQTVPSINGILGDVRTKTVPAVNETVAGYHKMAQAGTDFLTDLRGYLKPVIDKYNVVADNASKMMNEVAAVFGESKVDFKTTMANLRAATGTLSEKLPGVLTRVDGILAKVDGAVVTASEALLDIKKTVENTRDMTASAKAVISGNKGKLDGMIASMKATSDNLKNASSEIRRSPWRLLYTPKPGEMGNLNIYDSARQFAEGANSLSDASQALRDALKNKDTSPEELKRLMDAVDKSFGKFTDVEQTLWKAVKE